MDNVLYVLSLLIAAGVSLPVLSLAIEVLRRSPSPPPQLRWAPEIPIQTIEVNSYRLRYIKLVMVLSWFCCIR